jgi:glycosyltransferase involved in cell wall biosynthesis
MKKYIVISNDKIFLKDNMISVGYNDTINILDGIAKKFEIFLLSRNSRSKISFTKKIDQKITRLNYLSILSLKKNKNINLFLISITPRNFINYLIISFLLGKISGYIYLRSDGYQEYKTKIGVIGYFVYHIMLSYLKKKLKIISVSNTIYHSSKSLIITPSELDSDWFNPIKKIQTDIPMLLYVGRFKVEKGVFSLLRLFKNLGKDYKLSIVGGNRSYRKNSNVRFIKEIFKKKEIIKLYDSHNIFILPSYTEGSPKVILESLARLRPIIVFKEIKHVKLKFDGVFVCDRNSHSLEKKIKHILKNYAKIQEKMKKNILTRKIGFQNELIKILGGKN